MSWFSAILFLAGLSTILAIILALANQKLKVFEDPRIEAVTDMLPGANCGACGFPGCRAFSEKVVAGIKLPGDCPVGGQDTADTIADYLGIDPGSSVKRVARLLCAGGTDVAAQAGMYDGYPSCRAAAAVVGGSKACVYGCLGLADCKDVCDFDAIHMGPTGLPVVDEEKCTSCGDCVEICPKNLFEIMPINRHLIVQCKSLLEGDRALETCQVACTGCGKCAADAPEGLIDIRNNLAVINEKMLNLQTEMATLRCPTGAIVWLDEEKPSDPQDVFSLLNQG
ncbi:MAG: RnfABCDGE type electron transport complex subunit B [Calditrichaeota bacterium]|nr:RnfABCDGE type electron transport complex subunit B [Calditrichota bacterium]HQU74326.1 RnfABCDGE type electron transport complex subunit B [Calditrichia bacterium]